MSLWTVRRTGDRGCVALVHGFLGVPEAWSRVVDALPRGVSVVTATVPGHGPAPTVLDGHSFEAVAETLTRSLLARQPTWLVGYSLGGRLALAMALGASSRFAGLVTIGAQPGLAEEDARSSRRASDDALARDAEADFPRFVDAWEKLPLFGTQHALAPEDRSLRRSQRLAHTPRGIAWSLRTLGLGAMPDYGPALRRARLRCLFVAGALDGKFAAIARAMASATDRAEVAVVDGAGHDVVLEAPVAIATLIARFIEGDRRS